MRTVLEEIKTGTRTIAGTDWPVYDQLVKTGAREWTVVRELCNGTPRSAESFRPEGDARGAFEHRVTGPKPRNGSAATTRIELRLTASERDRWQAFADRQGLTLAALVRLGVERQIGERS